ncbi:MAG: DUF5685 family protein [Oscillospiraceae bacterium]|nr:DUF5685 family protein [Oscillospiraceae bacterium]
MFGYLRAYTPELKVREASLYKAVYCSLCRELGKSYGIAARMTLSYDFVLLAALLSPDCGVVYGKCRCPASLKKKSCCGIDCTAAAGASVILTYHKLGDDIRDERLTRRIAARLARILLRRGYKKARRQYAEFDKTVAECLARLTELETARSPVFDAYCDTFARITAASGRLGTRGAESPAISEALYCLGRYIYIADAADDYKEDEVRGRFNPIAACFGAFDENAKQRITDLLTLAAGSAGLQIEGLAETAYTPIIRNVVFWGVKQNIDRIT